MRRGPEKELGWGSRFGLIMAMAGNAVGIGNFLRFPGQAAPYGGAFMVPYFLALLLIGIPLAWMEWSIGRIGGAFKHGTTPGMFYRLWKHPISKYLGIFGILLPAMVGLYYIYIESWSLGYAWQMVTGMLRGKQTYEEMKLSFGSYVGTANANLISFSSVSYTFFLIAFLINIFILGRGISKGIEIVAKICMPILIILGVILTVRVLTLPSRGETQTVSHGLAQIWRLTPQDFKTLARPHVWIAATGQIFFTLSVGLGMLPTYASYLKKKHDLTLNGLTACVTNEFVEVVLAGSIVIPAAVVFFGVERTHEIVATDGTFAIGFYALPLIFEHIPYGEIFGIMWFFLLFLAGLTSSMAMFIPLLVFLEDELQIDRRVGVLFVAFFAFLMMQPVVLFNHHKVLDELDYWMGTFGLVVFVAIEAVVFSWIFGIDKGWKELHRGADLKVPRIYYYIMKYITPTFSIGLVAWYCYDGLFEKITMKNVAPSDVPYIWLARVMILITAAFLMWGVWYAWQTHPKFFEDDNNVEKSKQNSNTETSVKETAT